MAGWFAWPLDSDQKTVQQPIQQVPAAQKEVAIQPLQDEESILTEVAKEVATQPATLLHKEEQDHNPIASQHSPYVDRQVQFRTADNNILLSPQTLTYTVANASKEGDAIVMN